MGPRQPGHPFNPKEFAQRNHIPIFSLGFDRVMGCFARMRRENGGPDRVRIGLREDLVDNSSMVRDRCGTLVHELGHWATQVGCCCRWQSFSKPGNS